MEGKSVRLKFFADLSLRLTKKPTPAIILIPIKESLKRRLDRYKKYPKEPYSSVIKRILDEYEKLKVGKHSHEHLRLNKSDLS